MNVTNTSPTLIELENLTKTFERGNEVISALDGLNLKIRPGEFIAITGSSGSGKSTLMYILGLLDCQTSGSYRLFDRPTGTLSDTERSSIRNGSFGFVFQSFHLLPRADALRNVCMPLEYAGSYGRTISKKEMTERAIEALERVGLGDRMGHRPNELSGGQRQRVAIARALVNDPAVLFADEPTGNLDSRNAQEILQLFRSLHEDKRTVILVTHDATLADQAGRRIRMQDGKIIEDSNREAP